MGALKVPQQALCGGLKLCLPDLTTAGLMISNRLVGPGEHWTDGVTYLGEAAAVMIKPKMKVCFGHVCLFAKGPWIFSFPSDAIQSLEWKESLSLQLTVKGAAQAERGQKSYGWQTKQRGLQVSLETLFCHQWLKLSKQK